MGSIIPKINIGFNGKRSTNNLSFDSQTTTNIGFIQPTMARMLVADSSIKVKHRSLVRLAAMVNPTFGRLSQRDYFTFVKMSDIYRPWLEYLNAKPYTTDSGNSFVPENLPTFYMADVVRYLMLTNSYISISPVNYPDVVVGVNEVFSKSDLDSFINTLIEFLNEKDLRFITSSGIPVTTTFCSDEDELNNPFGYCSVLSSDYQKPDKVLQYYLDGGNIVSSNNEVVNITNSDFTLLLKDSSLNIQFKFKYTNEDATHTVTGGDWYLNFRLKPFAKNLRKILIGLGYGFNPWDTESYTPFSLIAYYKSWFDSFYPLKTQQFTDTRTYKFIKKCESADGSALNIQSDIYTLLFYEYKDAFYYYTQPDYFSASQYNLGDNNLTPNQQVVISSPSQGNINSSTPAGAMTNVNVSGGLNGNLMGLSLQMMLRLMRFTNKNNVIGRNLRDFAKIHFGIDDIDSDNKSVTKINACRTDIYFDDVLSQAKTNEAFLGEYAGYGIGSTPDNKAPVTFFSTKDWGFFFCMSVLVPESGYYQGSLKENKIKNRFEFFMPEFDALGYDVISRGEIKNDFDKEGFDWSPSAFDTKKGFGFIPRYTHFKVGRNIVNGDLTLGSTKEGLQGYFLDKQFPSYKLKEKYNTVSEETELSIESPDYLPEVVTNSIRKIDPSDNVGNYNRIFQYQKIDFDHFVIQKYFEVKVTAPWKSVSDSFDTVNSGEDTLERDHV